MTRHRAWWASTLFAAMLLASCGSDNTEPADSPRTITPEFLPIAVAGTAYSQALAADCPAGVTPVWSAGEGTLPPGLALEAAAIAGMPTTAGHYEFTIQVSCRGTGERDYEMDVVTPPTLTIIIPYPDGRLPYGPMGQEYYVPLLVTGGAGGTVQMRIASGTLPDGLSLTVGGILMGTPTGPPGDASFTIEATQGSLVARLATTLTIVPPRLAITPGGGAQLPDAVVGALSTVRFQATGGSEPYQWGVTTTIPTSWIAMDPESGELTFIPTTAGDYEIAPVVSGGFDATSTTVRVRVVAAGSDLRFTTGFNRLHGGDFAVPDGSTTGGMTIELEGTVEGGAPPYEWSVISDVPGGMTIYNSPARANGSAPVGNYQAVITVTDAAGHRQSQPVYMGVVTQFVQGSIPTPITVNLGAPLQQVVPISGGRSPYFCRVIAGSLPPGLTLTLLNGQYVIGGTPTASGTFSSMLECMDGSFMNYKYPGPQWQQLFPEYTFVVGG